MIDDESWAALGMGDATAKVRAALGFPEPPPGDLAEFAPRYLAAERAAWRYHRAMTSITEGDSARVRLDAAWPQVLAQLGRAGRLCEHGVRAQLRTGRPSNRRSQLPHRLRHLHNLHRALFSLERAADSAVYLAVAVALRRPVVTGSTEEVDAAVHAFETAVEELDATIRKIID